VGKASFEVVRQVLIDIRESTGYVGEGWEKLETYMTVEELEPKFDSMSYEPSPGAGVFIENGSWSVYPLGAATSGTPPPSLDAHSSPCKHAHMS
jgi:hypothetical protein